MPVLLRVRCCVVLDPKIFNVPIRRDIIHNVFKYERHLKYKKTHRTKTVGDVAGSGSKPRPQKHTGHARQGNIRASINYHGGKIFGAMPKDYEFPINKKLRLAAMKSLLTARLAENRVLLFEKARTHTRSTTSLAEKLYPLRNCTVLFLTERDADVHFKSASQNLPKLTVLSAIVDSFTRERNIGCWSQAHTEERVPGDLARRIARYAAEL